MSKRIVPALGGDALDETLTEQMAGRKALVTMLPEAKEGIEGKTGTVVG